MIEAKNEVFSLALSKRPIYIPPPSTTPLVTAIRPDPGSVGYYRSGVPFGWLSKRKLFDIFYGFSTKDLSEIERLKLMYQKVGEAAIVSVQRPWSIEQLRFIMSAKSRGKLVMIDTDDHLEATHTLGNNRLSLFWTKDKVQNFVSGLEMADLITVASPGLRKFYQERWPDKVHTLRNPADFASERWNIPHNKYPNKPLTIATFAGYTHNRDMELLPLERIMKKFPDLHYRCLGYQPESFKSLPWQRSVYTHYKDFDMYPADLAEVDILLVPLIDNDFNSIGKTDTKLFEAALAGCMCIASPVGDYLLWKEGKSILFARKEDDWVDHIGDLIADTVRIKEIAWEAAKFVTTFRSSDAVMPTWYTTLRSALNQFDRQPRDMLYGSWSARRT